MPAPSDAFSMSASDRKHVLVSYVDHSARSDVETGAVQLVRDANFDGPPPSITHAASIADGTSILADKTGRLLV